MRLTTGDDRAKMLRLAIAVSGIIIFGSIARCSSPASAQAIPGCPVMSAGQLAGRVDSIRSNYRHLLLAYRRAPARPLADESFAHDDMEFMKLAARCLREAEARMRRLQNGGLP